MIASGVRSRAKPVPPVAPEDPSALICQGCGNAYPLNSPRVRAGLSGATRLLVACGVPVQGVSPTALLCWVCTRLKHSVDEDAIRDAMIIRASSGGEYEQ